MCQEPSVVPSTTAKYSFLASTLLPNPPVSGSDVNLNSEQIVTTPDSEQIKAPAIMANYKILLLLLPVLTGKCV